MNRKQRKPGSDPRLLISILGGENMTETKSVRINSREAAAAILMTLARHEKGSFSFCCSFCYDYDSEFLNEVAQKLGLMQLEGKAFLSRIQRVCRKLEQAGILAGQVNSCHAEYIGEPRVLKSYEFGDHGYAMRLAPDLWPRYKPMGSTEVELDIILNRAFPNDNATRRRGGWIFTTKPAASGEEK